MYISLLQNINVIVMEAAKITIKTGPPVEGNDFYGREKELQYAWENLILKGVSLLLSAPRRVGKSSFSKKMLKLAEENEWNVLYLDLQGITAEDQFVRLFKDKLKSEKWWERTKTKIEETTIKLFDSIEDLEIAGNKISINSDVWRGNAYDKIQKIIEGADEILIVMDELTIFLDNLLKQDNGKKRVEDFLEWLRKFRQISETKVRWIFCSSVGIINFASMHLLSKHLNDVHSFPIGAYSEIEAKDFISRLDVSGGINFEDEKIQYILDKLKWYLPFFIQILVEKINFLVCVEGMQFSDDTIDVAYSQLLTEKHFNTWDERLKEYNELEDIARMILKLCTSPAGRSRGDLLANLSAKKSNIEKIETNIARLLAMLQNDGYLMENDRKYVFRSPLLRDFWYKRFVL